MQKGIVIIGIIIIAVIAAYALLSPGSENTSTINNTQLKWHDNLNLALQEAQNMNRPVFIDFYTTWCTYCKQLDETTLSDPRVQEKLASGYITVKIDADKNSDLASKYRIYGYPTILILNPDAQEIKRIEGYVDADSLLNQI
jgi:thiol:disulfide interchange protein DsbD